MTAILSPASSALAGENSNRDILKSDFSNGIPRHPIRSQGAEAQPTQVIPVPAIEASTENWRSPENEVKLGKFLALQLEQSQKFIRDPLANGYVNSITQKLAGGCDAPFPISVQILEADNINAVALPGGSVYISSGLVSATEDEAELAAAIAHQIAHTCAHQFVRGVSSKDFKKAAMRPMLIVDGSKFPPEFSGPIDFFLPPLTQDFPAQFEAEADQLALQYLYKAGYDPGALLTFFARLNALEKTNSGALSEPFGSHLQTPGRIHRTKKNVRALPRKEQYIVNSSEFDVVKARLLVLVAHRRKVNRVPASKQLNR